MLGYKIGQSTTKDTIHMINLYMYSDTYTNEIATFFFTNIDTFKTLIMRG